MALLAGACLICSASAASGRMSLGRLRSEFTKAYGGVQNLDMVKSLRLSGTGTQGGREFTFTHLRRRPNLMLMFIHVDDYDLIHGFDGERAWMQNPAINDGEPSYVDGGHLLHLKYDAMFMSPFLGGGEDSSMKLSYIEATQSETILLHRVRMEFEDGVVQELYIDDKYYYLRKLVTFLPGSAAPLETRYDRILKSGMLPIPYRIENYIDGKLVAGYDITKADFNTGILSGLFEKP